MKQRSYIFAIILSLEVVIYSLSLSQWSYLGLGGKAVKLLHANNGLLYAGTDSGLFRKSIYSSDTIWVPLGLESKDIRALLVFDNSIFISSVQISGTSGDTVSLFKSTDAGTHWFPFQNGFGGGEDNQVRSLAMSTSQPNVIYAAGGAIAKSTDGGMSWQRIYGDSWSGAYYHHITIDTSWINVIWLIQDNIWLGGSTILKSTTSGETWRGLSAINGISINSIALNPSDSNVVYAGMWGAS
jgi:photosystem II stability/assembly factor-like uncharacterized protein